MFVYGYILILEADMESIKDYKFLSSAIKMKNLDVILGIKGVRSKTC